MSERISAPRLGARGWACAAVLALAATGATASHVGEPLQLDQAVVASTDQLLTALRDYERTPAAQRAALAAQLTQLASARRDAMIALIERDPTIAALRVLGPSVRARLPQAAQALVEQPVTVQGSVAASVGDDFEHGRAQTHLQLADTAGRKLELRAAQASQREQLGWVGKRGAVQAMQLDRYLLVVDKRQVQLAAAGGTSTGTQALAPAGGGTVQGVQNTLVVMLNFNDKAIECTPADVQGRLFGSSGATLDQGYRQSSNSLVSFVGQVAGPFTINYSSTGSCDYNGWAAAANAAAQAAGFNPGAYTRVSYATPRNSNCGWTGLGQLGGTSPTPSWVQQCTGTGVFSHEIGHNLNFHHAATPTAEYGDASDPMGAALLVQSNGANRVMAGWISGSRLQDVSSGGSYALSALESTTPSSPQVLRLAKPDTGEFYYVSLRQPVGVDSALWTTYQKVNVHKSTGTLPAYTYLLASLDAGQSWSDPVNGITVSSQGVSGSTASVSVAFGGATCTRQAPTLAVAPASQSGAPGASLGYTLSLTNNDSAACPSAGFSLAQTLPSGFSGSLATTSVSLAPGASTSVAWSVASSTSSPDAVYTLDASATASASGSSAATHASYTVVSPTPTPTPTGDTTAPVVGITSPAAGATVSGRVSLAAQASDNVGVASVQFYVDGKLLATDTGTPYTATWSARKAAKGLHTIRARALDAAGNAAEQSVSVTVN